MQNGFSTACRPLALVLGLCLSAGLIIPAADAARSQEVAWPVRDFLPPVASINPRIDDQTAQNDDQEVEVVSLSAVTSPVLHTTPKINRLAGSLGDQFKSEQLQTVLSIQKQVDEADLERLWQATVEKNPVIRFSLEKIATPPDLQTKQSSKFLTKTLSTLISGATMAATMMPGGGGYRDMGTMALGNALQNIVDGKNQPQGPGLTATEQIQLAGLIDDLKIRLIQGYQNYKTTLQTLAQSHEVTIKNNNLYSKALASKNEMAMMAAGISYYQALMNETALRQKAKLYRLELERLAGREAVSSLQLAVQLPAANDATANLQPGPAPEPASALIGPLPEEAPNAATPPEGLPEPMEIGPQLEEKTRLPEPLPVQPAATSKQKQVQAASSADPARLEIPAPLPDKLHTGSILELREELQ